MAIADHFKPAHVFESLGWAGLPHATRVAKAAHLYLKSEKAIDDKSRNYEGPTKNIVKTFISSLFVTPHGMGAKTVADVMVEIRRQRGIRDSRVMNPPFKPRLVTPNRRERLLAVAKHHYRIVRKDFNDNIVFVSGRPITLTKLSGCTVIADIGGIYDKPRIFMRCNKTHQIKVVVLGLDSNTLPLMLVHMASPEALSGLFGGKTITLDFHNEGFIVEGKSVPWRNVLKVYRGRKACRRTFAAPRATKKE